ncbi:hypothetical protein QTJ16_000307 [Diplocarpon rosae]|uniref:Borealin N-terminal domain-containing protein n=1 Tax=Diplocarpon rosae TaxID=946125 RepID=A0AAD9T5P0_9HELO|nr:hypothetical protein QTJ16_000307 [Diplocarpon rosae]
MAPTRSKKPKSTESTSSVDIQTFPIPPQMIPAKTCSPARTPTNRSPIKKPTQKMGITMAQKQALIDNLQLEITERARKLRAQYNLQAQGLKARIEIRVNRIPTALRRAKMGDLYIKYSGSPKPVATSPVAASSKIRSPRKHLVQADQSVSRVSPSPQRPSKRPSNDISLDKENDDICNPSKRIRGPQIPSARTTSKIPASQVLSPRSANSRTLLRSPIRPTSPTKPFPAPPTSQLKHAVPVTVGGAASILTSMVEKAKSGRGTSRKVTIEKPAVGTGRARRVVPSQSSVPAPKAGRGRGSEGSEVAAPAPLKMAPTRKTVISTLKGMGKKAPAGSKAPAAGQTAGRTLRKRN